MTRRLVVDLRCRAGAFRLPDAVADALVAATPAGWETYVVAADTDAAGGDAFEPSDEAVTAIANAEVYFGYGLPPALFAAARQLRWVHTATVGVATVLYPEVVAADVLVTNSAGLYGPPIAEHVLGGVLFFLRGFDLARDRQRQTAWDPPAFAAPAARLREVSECRVLVIGTGGIGGEVACRFTALGARVTGVRRRPELGVPPGFARVLGPDALDAALGEADILVLAAPLTPLTHAMLTGERFARLPAGAIVCNVARGALLDEPALVRALQSGQVRGAVLDVFAEEPLPPASPLWQLPQVLLTPHVAGVSPRLFWERLLALFLDNWARYRAGEPLRNLVDKQAGY